MLEFATEAGATPSRATITVTDKSGNNQLGLLWHARCKNYDPAETARWIRNAESLELLDLAEKVTLSGSAGTKVVKHPNLSTSWTPVLGLTLSAGTYLTHKGLYDLWVRVYTTSADPPSLRLLYDVGDIVAPAENQQVKVPGTNNFYLVNLGQVNLQQTPFGEYRWKGVIQAYGENGGENLSIDTLFLMCGDEGSGVLSAPPRTSVGSSAFVARDGFNQTAGALTGKSADSGQVWALAGDAVGMAVEATAHKATRAEVSDKSGEGAYQLCGSSSYSNIAVSMLIELPAVTNYESGWAKYGVFCRYSSLSKSLCGTLSIGPNGGFAEWFVTKGAGYGTILGQGKISPALLSSYFNSEGWNFKAAEIPLTLIAVSTGYWYLYLGGALVGSGFSSLLVSGGELATGKFGAVDEHVSAKSFTRAYDNFIAYPLEQDAVIFANEDVRLSTQGIFRKTADGNAYGDVAYPGSDLPRIPCSGAEERPVEIAIKPSRGVPGESPDLGLDKISAQLNYRPCWSYIPSE